MICNSAGNEIIKSPLNSVYRGFYETFVAKTKKKKDVYLNYPLDINLHKLNDMSRKISSMLNSDYLHPQNSLNTASSQFIYEKFYIG